MIALFAAGIVCVIILTLAARIVMLWTLPTATAQAIFRAVDRGMTFLVKLVILALAALILFAIWYAFQHT